MKCYVQIFILIVVLNHSSSIRTRALVIEEEGSSAKVPKFVEPSTRQDFLCSPGNDCVPLSGCPLVAQLLKRSCLQTDKLGGLTCGYKGREPLVCCPQSCPGLARPSWPQAAPASGQQQCGRPQLASPSAFGLGSHPWLARVGFRNTITNKIDYLCCGSIINRRTILTAAHCALAKTASHKIASVKVGEYDSSQGVDCLFGYCTSSTTDLPLNHIVVHPKYDSKTFSNNIALLVLKYPLNYSVSVQPICIYQEETNYIYVNQRPQLIGWGKLSNQIGGPPQRQRLDLPVLPLETCTLLYGASVPISETQLCVGGEGKDACTGFGGAPLVLLEPHTRAAYYQIGLLSFGSEKCGLEGIPSIYTRVDKYADWIELNSAKE